MRSITRRQWITLFAAQAGYMLDAMDVLLFVLTINVLRDAFHLSAAQAGLVSSFTLAFSAAGGIVFGMAGASQYSWFIGCGVSFGLYYVLAAHSPWKMWALVESGEVAAPA